MIVCGTLMGCGFIDYERRDTHPSADAASAPEDTAGTGNSSPAGVPSDGSSGAIDSPPPSGLTSIEDAWIDDATVAFFHFGGASPLQSRAGSGLLEALEPDVTTSFVDGPFEGVQALDFREGSSPLLLPDSPMWQLSEGSIDFYLRVRSCAAPVGFVIEAESILSRDAIGFDFPGHLHINLDRDCSIYARIQGESQGTENRPESELRSEVLTRDEWHHVGINFGGAAATFSLWIDGVEHRQRPWPHGIDGNQNPWVLGGGTYTTPEGSAEGWNAPFSMGAVALWRISSARRDFSQTPIAD